MNLLFVYGTLKKGCSNHHLLGNLAPVSENFTDKQFRMLDLGHFPAVVKDEKVSRIYGELYNVGSEMLKVLDDFEGKWFNRDEVVLDDGSRAAMYFLSAEVPCERYPVIRSGNWTCHNLRENRY